MGVRLIKYNRNTTNTQGGVMFNDHDELYNRDLKNQHPIYAITGLQEVLNVLEDNITETNRLLIKKNQATNARIDTILLDIEAIQKDIENIYDVISNLNIIKDVQDTSTVDLDYDTTTKILKANVKVYEDTKNNSNAIQVLTDGLYVPKILTEDSNTVTWYIDNPGESLYEIFNNGIKFSHYTNSWSNVNSVNDANAWHWDDSLQSFVKSNDNTTFTGIVTKNFYDYYIHTVTLCSTDSDNDDCGVIIGFVFDENGYPHTLSAICSRRGTTILDWALVYDYMLPDQQILFRCGNGTTGTVPTDSGSSGWNNYSNGITVTIIKNKNLITATCSDWNSNILNENTKISIDLNDYSWGYLFQGLVRYGYCNYSQQNSFFQNINFASINHASANLLIASVKISQEANNEIIEKDDGIYAPAFTISPDDNNILTKKQNGYYVEGLQISKELDNCLEKLSDGLYVRDQSNVKLVTQTNHEFSVGDFIYYRPNYGYKLAAAIDSYDSNIVGMVTKIIDDNTFEYMWSGFFKTDIFTENNGFVQGMPMYISDTEPGHVVQEQPDISKTVGYPVENIGLIISIERGIQYNQEASIGDFKTSANTYNVRSDGFIKVIENIDYKQTLIERLLDTLDDNFKSTYMIFNDFEKTVQFTNIEQLYVNNKVPDGLNLFIKAF